VAHGRLKGEIMKHQASFVVFAAAAIAASVASSAHAADDLVSKGRNDRVVDENGNVMVQSALTTVGDAQSPYVAFSENNGFGNSRFGAGYTISSYSGTWAPGVAYASSNTSVYGTAFNNTKTLFEQGISAYTDAAAQSASISDYVYALGFKVAGGTYSGGDYNGTYYLANYSKQLYSASETFWVGPVPVNVSATINASAGHSIYGHFWVDGIQGNMSPYARAWVTASAGVGVSGAGAGIRVSDLSLINVGLPHAAKARYTDNWASGACQGDFNLGSNLGLSLATLKGTLQLYATLIWTTTRTIASWNGLSKFYPLVNYSATFPSYNPSCISVPAAPQFQGIIIG
jgi:hypothetical protein